MPHCVIECPASIETAVDLDILVKAVHDAADSTGLFAPGDVKSRLTVYHHDMVGGRKDDYVHVTIGLLSGRTDGQKKAVSSAVARAVCDLLPGVHFISVDVRDFCLETYSNRASLDRLAGQVAPARI
nr:5-carboxymethyl-2-hydroxymuconate Delta-isomerase [Sphingobium sp. AS12]